MRHCLPRSRTMSPSRRLRRLLRGVLTASLAFLLVGAVHPHAVDAEASAGVHAADDAERFGGEPSLAIAPSCAACATAHGKLLNSAGAVRAPLSAVALWLAPPAPLWGGDSTAARGPSVPRAPPHVR